MIGLWVLGSKTDKADKWVDWEVPLSDFRDADILVINLQTLGTAVKNDFLIINALFDEAQRYIFDMLMMRDKQIIVVIPTVLTHMKWLPIYPNLKFSPPKKIEKVSIDQSLRDYIENVETTDYYLDGMNFSFTTEKRPKTENAKVAQEYYSTKLLRDCDILNTTKQLVGGAFKMEIDRRQTYLGALVSEEHFVSSSIMFLPPPTKISVEEGIDVLLKTIIFEEEPVMVERSL